MKTMLQGGPRAASVIAVHAAPAASRCVRRRPSASVVDGCVDGEAQQYDLQTQACAGRDEVLEVIDPIDGRTVPTERRRFRRNFVQTLHAPCRRQRLARRGSHSVRGTQPQTDTCDAPTASLGSTGCSQKMERGGSSASALVGDFPQPLSRRVQCRRIHPFHGCAP